MVVVGVPGWCLGNCSVSRLALSLSAALQAVFVVGIPACVLGGLLYSYTSGMSVVDGIIAAYGALYKVPGVRPQGLQLWWRQLCCLHRVACCLNTVLQNVLCGKLIADAQACLQASLSSARKMLQRRM